MSERRQSGLDWTGLESRLDTGQWRGGLEFQVVGSRRRAAQGLGGRSQSRLTGDHGQRGSGLNSVV